MKCNFNKLVLESKQKVKIYRYFSFYDFWEEKNRLKNFKDIVLLN